MKRASGLMGDDAKRALTQGTTLLWLEKHHATEEQMLEWCPKVLKKEFGWQEDVECILAECYSVFDAVVYSDSTQLKDGKAHARSIAFKGTCPFHGRVHSNNNWTLINTKGYSTTLFICHNSNVRRLVRDRFPFPVED